MIHWCPSLQTGAERVTALSVKNLKIFDSSPKGGAKYYPVGAAIYDRRVDARIDPKNLQYIL